MNNLKSHLTCQYCSKILKHPMTLPCGHTLCEEHLHQNTIECVSCQEVFNLKETRLIRVVSIDCIIGEELFLNGEEKSLKSKLIESFSTLNRLNQDFQIAKDTYCHFELESHEHFQEIRRQIDIHREGDKFNAESRSNIDTIALDMIDRTKDFERNYFKCFDDLVKKNLLFEEASIDVNKETLFFDKKASKLKTSTRIKINKNISRFKSPPKML
jgi:hypothetical protein